MICFSSYPFHVVVVVNASSNTFVPFGFQEPEYENSDSFASSIVYDRDTRVMYLIGSTYSSVGIAADPTTSSSSSRNENGGLRYSDCYIHALTLSSTHPLPSKYGGVTVTPLFSKRLGTVSNAETCLHATFIVPSWKPISNKNSSWSSTSLYSQIMILGSVQTTSTVLPSNDYLLSKLLMMPSSSSSLLTSLNRKDQEEMGGYLSSLKPFGATSANNYGFLLQLNIAANAYDSSSGINDPTQVPTTTKSPRMDVTALTAHIQSASLIQSVATQIPIAFTCDGSCGRLSSITTAAATPNTTTTIIPSTAFFVLYRTSTSLDPTMTFTKDVYILQKRVFKSLIDMDYEMNTINTMFYNYFGFDRWNIHSSSSTTTTTTTTTQDIPWIQGMKVIWNQNFPSSFTRDKNSTLSSSSSSSSISTWKDIRFIPISPQPMLLLIGDISLTTVDPDTGSLVRTYHIMDEFIDSNNTTDNNNNKNTNLENTQIMRTCTHMKQQQDSAPFLPFLYLVGYTTVSYDSSSTTSSKSKKLFLVQVDVTTMETLWIRFVGSTKGIGDVIAYDCVVTSDDEQVFVSGTVDNDDTILIPSLKKQNVLHSSGGKDIVILGYNTRDGILSQALQYGTSKDDSLSSHKSLVLDESDNLIIFGNTRGSMMRLRTKQEDLSSFPGWDFFVMNIERNTGSMRPVVEFVDIRTRRNKAFLWFLFVPLLALVCYLLFRTWNHRQKQKYGIEWTGSNDSVLQYLDNFKDDRVELHIRHSATGTLSKKIDTHSSLTRLLFCIKAHFCSSFFTSFVQGGIHGIYEFVDKKKAALGLTSSSRYSSRPYTLENLPGPIGFPQSIPSPLSRQRSADFVRKSMFSIDDDEEGESGQASEPNEKKRMISRTSSSSTNDTSSKGEIAYSILSKRRNNWGDDADYASLVESYDSTWAERSAHTIT